MSSQWGSPHTQSKNGFLRRSAARTALASPSTRAQWPTYHYARDGARPPFPQHDANRLFTVHVDPSVPHYLRGTLQYSEAEANAWISILRGRFEAFFVQGERTRAFLAYRTWVIKLVKGRTLGGHDLVQDFYLAVWPTHAQLPQLSERTQNSFEIKGLPHLALLPPVLQCWSFHKVERSDTVARILDAKPTDGDYLYHTEWRLVRQNGHHADEISAFHLTWKVNAFMQHTAEQERLKILPAGTLVFPAHVNDDNQECFTLHSLLVVFGREAPPSAHEPQARRLSSASTVRPSHADVLDPLSLIGTGDSQATLV